MLQTTVRARAVLALTATATATAAASIAEVLGIAPSDIIRDDTMRSNLRLGVTHHNGGACPLHFPPFFPRRPAPRPTPPTACSANSAFVTIKSAACLRIAENPVSICTQP